MKEQTNKEQSPVVSISGKDKKFLAAILFFQTSVLVLTISLSGTFHNSSLEGSIKNYLRIKTVLNKLEGDMELKKQEERYRLQGLSTEDVK